MMSQIQSCISNWLKHFYCLLFVFCYLIYKVLFKIYLTLEKKESLSKTDSHLIFVGCPISTENLT